MLYSLNKKTGSLYLYNYFYIIYILFIFITFIFMNQMDTVFAEQENGQFVFVQRFDADVCVLHVQNTSHAGVLLQNVPDN